MCEILPEILLGFGYLLYRLSCIIYIGVYSLCANILALHVLSVKPAILL